MKRITEAQLNSMKSMGGAEYACQEAWDVQQAAQALSMVAQMVHNEVDEPLDMMTLSDIMLSLVEFIKGEIKEMESAASQGEQYAKSVPAEVKTSPLNLTYAKSLNIATLPDLAVKYVALDQIKGYTYLWGNPQMTDVEMEYFTKDTNFWDTQMGKSPRPLTWDHAQDETLKATPVIGTITDFGDDEIGRWYVAKLDRSHKYRKAIDALIEAGNLGTSSDSAPQYVQRVKTGKSTWLKEWPWFASALTDTPAEPRMIDSLEFYKSIGIKLPDTSVKTWQWDAHRIKLLSLKQEK